MFSGSAIRPSPESPLANSPISAGIIMFPKPFRAKKFEVVDWCLYISKSIAGAK